MVGGRKAWGDFPWHEASFIGGSASNRGFVQQRFAGEEAAYGSAELRLRLFDSGILFPSRTWIFGLADVGRVWADGDDSDEWHPSYGGGVVVHLRATPIRLRAEWARNDDEDSNNFYFATGFAF
jgi:outer membrane protein assembly factor BamA